MSAQQAATNPTGAGTSMDSGAAGTGAAARAGAAATNPGTANPTTSSSDSLVLRSGIRLPWVGFGTWALDDKAASQAVSEAINVGYRLVDSASRYHNEFGVGLGLKWADVRRDQVLVTSKVRGGDQGYENTLRAFMTSRRNLGVDYVDIFYIHWPRPDLDLYVETFKAMQKLRDDGYIRTLAVCNFEVDYLERLAHETGELPEINQVELHLAWPQDELVEQCQKLGVAVQAWGSVGRGKGMLQEPAVLRVAQRHGVTPAQVALAWIRQRGAAALVKSSHVERMRENLGSLRVALTEQDFEELKAVPRFQHGRDPRTNQEA